MQPSLSYIRKGETTRTFDEIENAPFHLYTAHIQKYPLVYK